MSRPAVVGRSNSISVSVSDNIGDAVGFRYDYPDLKSQYGMKPHQFELISLGKLGKHFLRFLEGGKFRLTISEFAPTEALRVIMSAGGIEISVWLLPRA